MNDKNASLQQRIGSALHAHFDNVVRQPLPQRWVDLIKWLDEKERAEAEPVKSGTAN